MKLMNTAPQPWTVRLAAMLVLAGSNLVAASEPVALPQADAVSMRCSVASEIVVDHSPANSEVIRIAWDRVGALA